MGLTERTVVENCDALGRREISSVELVEALIEKTDAAKALNCYVAFDAEGLRRQAQQADQARAAGQRLPLLGVPVALKDNIQAVGFACGNGTAALSAYHPTADADVVRRLRAAGALIPGKVGMHELAFGISTNNAFTGAVRNPWEQSAIPGGSSGGSGAAVAAGLVPASIGTDTGGSVRVPAALCGVYGLRPTAGRVSRAGIAPISSTRDTAGPIARSVEDLALLDSVLTGDFAALPEVSLRGLRLGVPQNYFWEDLDPGVRTVTEAALKRLAASGAELVPVRLPGIAALVQAVGPFIALYEFTRDMGAYLREGGPGVSLARLVSEVASPDVAAIVRPLLGEGAISSEVYLQSMEARRRLQELYAQTFRNADVAALVFPTTPSTAAKIGEDETFLLNGSARPTFTTFVRNTDPGSNAGIPGISLPIGLSGGLPVGLALDGPQGSDRMLLSIAAAAEAVLPPMPRAPLH